MSDDTEDVLERRKQELKDEIGGRIDFLLERMELPPPRFGDEDISAIRSVVYDSLRDNLSNNLPDKIINFKPNSHSNGRDANLTVKRGAVRVVIKELHVHMVVPTMEEAKDD